MSQLVHSVSGDNNLAPFHLWWREIRLKRWKDSTYLAATWAFDTWYYIVICATLCLSFSSKSKAANVFPKHILKSKARDQLIQARNNLFCHKIVKNYLCNVLCKFLIKIESIWRRKIKDQTPQLALLNCARTVKTRHRRCSIKKAVFKNFAISMGNTYVGVSSFCLQLY